MNNWILSLVNTLILFVAVIVAGFLVGGRYHHHIGASLQ